jgi:hypothetical protein
MRNVSWYIQRLISFISKPFITLFIVTLFVYGFFIPFLGFYWDELMLQWIAQVLGKTGLINYFSTNRPLMGFLYSFTTSVLGDDPWQWQMFAIFWRWLAAYGFFSLGMQLWKEKTPALLAALIFLTYPGFAQQYIATVYGHFFLVLSAFFFSLAFSLMAVQSQDRKRFLLLNAVALLLSAVNLFSMEYFFMLELLRPVLLWVVLWDKSVPVRHQIVTVIKHWQPYLLVFLAAGFWRAFLFDYQTNNYEVGLLEMLLTNPLQTILILLGTVLWDLWQTVLKVWELVLQFPGFEEFGPRAWMIIFVFSLALLLFVGLVLFWLGRHSTSSEKSDRSKYWKSLWIALIALLLAGVPFWLTQIPIGLTFPNDRFTLPFILGVALFWVSVMMLIPLRRWVLVGVLVLAVALSAAYQLRMGIQFQRDWEQQTRFFWQMSWRIPALQEDTIIFAHELPLKFFSDNSLTGGLNWIYSNPDWQDNTIPFVLYYPTVRVGLAVKALTPNEPVNQNLLVGDFYGNTSQSIALVYQPPACLRVLDPELESDNWMVPLQVRETIHLTNWDVILPEPQHFPPAIYGSEPTHGWCYYFQKADLARQLGDWDEVLQLAEIAFQLDDQPNDPVERFPFIEAYAHLGLWQKAVEMSNQSAAVSPVIHPAICRLWDRIKRETQNSEEKSSAIQRAIKSLQCEAQP